MSPSHATPATAQARFGLGDWRLYLATAAMVLGNVLLPLAVHRFPNAGQSLLPIFFFTLVAGWRFGARAGVITAVLSPLANHALTGMPPAPALQGIILQSALLGALAGLVAARRPKATLPLLALVVTIQQGLGVYPLLGHGFGPALAVLKLHLPGILLQILGGFAVLRLLDRWLPRTQDPVRAA